MLNVRRNDVRVVRLDCELERLFTDGSWVQYQKGVKMWLRTRDIFTCLAPGFWESLRGIFRDLWS